MLISQMMKLSTQSLPTSYGAAEPGGEASTAAVLPGPWTSLQAPALPPDAAATGRWGRGDQPAQPSPSIKGETEEKKMKVSHQYTVGTRT